ncbi:hypothetical protein [Luedemannella helvata]|uniref:hypothetical protein n=1 Tax=Luedemannella helvata TaxID=349315 RepID=UPI0031E1995C
MGGGLAGGAAYAAGGAYPGGGAGYPGGGVAGGFGCWPNADDSEVTGGGGVVGAVPGGGPSTVGDENAENVDVEGESTVGDEKPENVEAAGSGTGRGLRTGSGVAPPSAALATR